MAYRNFSIKKAPRVVLSFFCERGNCIMKLHSTPLHFAGNTPVQRIMTHTPGDASTIVHHAGEPAAVLLPPCRGTPRPWKLLQESTPWPSPGVLNSLNIHQPSPQHERKRKKSTLTAVGPPAGTQICGAQPRRPPGRALQVATQGKKRFVPFRNKREAD